jgi:hypothetical protein
MAPTEGTGGKGEGMGTAVHVAADGSAVTFAGSVDLTAVATSSVRYQDTGFLRELTTAPVAAADSLPFTFDEEYAYAGGQVRIGHRSETDPSIRSRRDEAAAIWRGTAHALVIIESGGTADGLLAVLDTLDLDERPEGLAVGSDRLLPATTKLVKELPGIGLAEVAPLVPEVAQALPRWAGTEVRGGELYRDEARPGAPVLLLVGDTTSTTLLLDGAGPTADTATTMSTELSVTWTAA